MAFRRAIDVLREEGPIAVAKKAARLADRRVRKAVLKLSRGPFIRSKYGVYLSKNWGDQTFEFCILGHYGFYLYDYIRSQRAPFVFLDIGANQGLYTLIAAKSDACIHAHAFEPVSKSFNLLERNIAANDLTAKITAHNIGISTSDADVPIFLTSNHSGAASLHNRNFEGSTMETVALKTADYITPMICDNSPIIVKIDVEGHEDSVIQSLANAPYANRISSVFYEVDERWVDPRRLEFILRSIGMKDFVIIGTRPHYDVLARRSRTL